MSPHDDRSTGDFYTDHIVKTVVEILTAGGLIQLSKRATRSYIYGTSTYVLI